MDLNEISDQLDTRLKSFEGGISADEYEKSLYLSRVQKDIYYGLLKAFEQNGIITNALKPFVVNVVITAAPGTLPITVIAGAQYFKAPDDVEKIIYETAELDVIANPLLHERVTRIEETKVAEMSLKQDNPFREPNRNETLKVISVKTSTDNTVELHAIANVGKYSIKYFKTITPIILEGLPDSLTIDGLSAETNTLFNDEVLNRIIEGAALAILRESATQKQNV